MKTKILASLAPDIEVQRRAGHVSGEFLIKLILEIYANYCESCTHNGGQLLPGTEPVRPDELREMSLEFLKKFLREIAPSLSSPFDLDSESAAQLSAGKPSYVSMLLTVMIFASVIQQKGYDFGYVVRAEQRSVEPPSPTETEAPAIPASSPQASSPLLEKRASQADILAIEQQQASPRVPASQKAFTPKSKKRLFGLFTPPN